jgi:hypothetical protein
MQRNRLGQFSGSEQVFHQGLYEIWYSMKKRCYNSKAINYERYGGRGITICDEWLHNFHSFAKWSICNGYEKGLQLDRIDNDKGYSPENCKFSTAKEQANNRRSNVNITFEGRTQTLKMWAEEAGINYWTVHKRIVRLHWSFEKAIRTPTREHKVYVNSILREVQDGQSIPDTC